MAPLGAVLEQHLVVAPRTSAMREQPGRAEATPVPVALRAPDPAVAVAGVVGPTGWVRHGIETVRATGAVASAPIDHASPAAMSSSRSSTRASLRRPSWTYSLVTHQRQVPSRCAVSRE